MARSGRKIESRSLGRKRITFFELPFEASYPKETTVRDCARSREQVRELVEKTHARLLEIRADENLSDLGRQGGSERTVRLARAALAGIAGRVARGRELFELDREKLRPVPPREVDDMAGGLFDMEIRTWVRSLPREERSNALLSGDVAPGVVAAVLRGPAELSGITPEIYQIAERRALAGRHGEKLAAQEEEVEAIKAVEQALHEVDEALSDVEHLPLSEPLPPGRSMSVSPGHAPRFEPTEAPEEKAKPNGAPVEGDGNAAEGPTTVA